MHIKSLTIQGFKTYRDAVIIDPLSENVNVVVGRNGAGKSNFFSAIRFVLSDAYTSLSRAERQALLHEGSSTAATFSAYVEIVFDNSDGRIPTGKNEVILRRTIGAKKDDYSLDRKSTSKAEVMSLLESAGFSKSNPFFIVPQGRITSLTNQKDSERLELLKEIAGTRVYEDRKQESLRIMAETEQKQVKIDELLTFIDERLIELEEEKKELKEFQVADKERRCTEYCIYQHDLEEAKEALDEIDDERLNEQRQADDMRKISGERETQLAEAEAYITEQKEKLELVTLEKQQVEADKNESIKAQTQLELLIRDLEDTTERNASERQGLQSDLEELEKKILAKQRTLDESMPKYQDLLAKEADLKSKIEETEARQQSLLAKQGRAAQFRTQAERDRYLRSQIQSSKATLETRQKIFDETSQEIEATKTSLEQGTKDEAEMRKTLETRRANAKTLTTELADLNAQRQTLVEQQKEGWKDDEKLTKTVSHARDELKKAEQSLSMTMDQATRKGLAGVRQVVSRLRLEGVYGPLYELFEVNESFRTAVENIANTSLFHVVVDTDETASRILDVMVREQLGRVTFMPLNRLKPAQVRYPEQEEEAVPMISRLKFDERFRPAMSQVFGKAIIVPDLHMGAAYARSHGLTAITLQGDKQDKKGALTGGFHDSRRSRLESVKTVKHWEDKLRADQAKHNETKQAERRLQQEISELSGKIQIVERKLNQAKDARDPLNAEIAAVQVEIEQNKVRLESLQRELGDIQTHISHLNIQIETQEDEVKTPMTDALSEEEAETLNRLAIEMQKDKKELNETSKDRQAMASKRSSLEIELGQNLVRKRDKIKEKLDSMADIGGDGPTQVETALAKHTASLESLQRTIETIVEKVQAVDKETERIKSAIASKEKESELLQAKQTEDSRGFAKQQKNVERYLAKRQILIVRKDECSKKIRELGALPPEAFERQKQRIQIKKLYKDLHSANEKLKKFGTVNKRAFDQFNEFTTQREELDTRREELTKSEESIRELVDHLDMRKDEAIERTFKQVSKNFIEVFETLVPTGRGRLIMQKQLDQDDSDEDEEDEEDEVVEEEEEEDEEDEDDDQEEEEEDEDADDMDVDEDEPTSKRRKKASAKGKTSGKAKASGKSSKGKSSTSKKGCKTYKSGTAAAKKKKQQQASKNKKKKKKGAIDAYTGISIKVSFNSKSDEGLRIQQLSGGQKSLVALAMIFAIQKCDPAPFYLFDEIDANLDADRRTAVANMIKSLSTSAQFIITTFRPELLTAADNFWGVMFDARKISTIKRITRDDAYTFIESASGPAPPQTGSGR